jgi:hypothetical protein
MIDNNMNQNKKTAVQEVFIELEKLHPNLFDIYTEKGRQFVHHFHKFLEIEKKQIIAAVEWNYKSNMGEVYYNAVYKNNDNA